MQIMEAASLKALEQQQARRSLNRYERDLEDLQAKHELAQEEIVELRQKNKDMLTENRKLLDKNFHLSKEHDALKRSSLTAVEELATYKGIEKGLRQDLQIVTYQLEQCKSSSLPPQPQLHNSLKMPSQLTNHKKVSIVSDKGDKALKVL